MSSPAGRGPAVPPREPRTQGKVVSPTHLSRHLKVARYDEFLLTDAVRPAAHVPVRPREGYRRGHYREPRSRRNLPILNISVSAERLFDVFLALLAPLGEVVDVIV